MRIQKFNFENKESIQMYINKVEQNDSKVIEQINVLKNKYSNILIFISGENDAIKTVKEMLNYEKSKNMK